ncbi:MAG: pyridoxamine 5'-phosphate oxidase family protein [Anaerolineae bacterium]|nr:pyridoxamine 5'-phosphate oxidase family protein [Anaerolineae bacterium]
MVLDDTIREILQQPLVARVSTLDPDGFPHTVPIWYMLDGDDIVIATGEGARNLRNIRANPKGAVVIGGEPKDERHIEYAPGYLCQGEFVIEDDPDQAWIRRIAHHYRDDDRIEQDITAWGTHTVIRLKIRNVIKVMP